MTPTTGAEGPVGVLLVDKDAGPTSHDVVDRARRALGTRRVGHTGTLDPFATGLLVLLVGPATRLAEYFHLLDKTYEAVLRLGEETRSHDPEGEMVRTSDAWRDVSATGLERVLTEHTGRQRQRPPAFSAKRVDGGRAHHAARAGREVELEPVEVIVHGAELVDLSPPDARVRFRVSTGTYVRALARDVGRALGCGAYLRKLRRTSVGPFDVGRAVALAGLVEGTRPESLGDGWLDPARGVAWLPSRALDAEEAETVRHGGRVSAGDVQAPSWDGAARPDDGRLPVALVREGHLLAVAERGPDHLQPRKVFPDAA